VVTFGTKIDLNCFDLDVNETQLNVFQDNSVCTATEKIVEAAKVQEEPVEAEEPEAAKKEDERKSSSSSEDDEEKKSKKKKKKSKKKKRKKDKKEKTDFEKEVAAAMKKQEEEEKKAEKLSDDRKRSYNNVLGFEAKAPTEAEMEAFYRKRKREDDPMMQFL